MEGACFICFVLIEKAFYIKNLYGLLVSTKIRGLLVVVLIVISIFGSISPVYGVSSDTDNQYTGFDSMEYGFGFFGGGSGLFFGVSGFFPLSSHVNTSGVRHVDPDSVNENRGIGGLNSWFINQFKDRIRESAEDIKEGQYSRARELFSDRYLRQLRNYADLTEETESETDEQSIDRLRQLQEKNQLFIRQVENYRNTKKQYTEKKQNGSITTARNLGRNLKRLDRDINQTTEDILFIYTKVSNLTQIDLSVSKQDIKDISRNISLQQKKIEGELFVKSNISVYRRYRSQNISFLDPLKIKGKLLSQNGNPIKNGTIQINTEKKTKTTKTDRHGNYTLTYRPVFLSLNTEKINIEYIPDGSTIYLGSKTNTTINITQTTPNLFVENYTKNISFRDSFSASGKININISTTKTKPKYNKTNSSYNLSISNISNQNNTNQTVRYKNRSLYRSLNSDIKSSLGGLPISVSVGGETLGVSRTEKNGRFNFKDRFPYNILNGSRDLNISLSLKNRAIGSISKDIDRAINVDSTDTSLSFVPYKNIDNTVYARGLLETNTTKNNSGVGIGGVPIEISIKNQTIDSVRTNPNGTYSIRFEPPGSIINDLNPNNRKNSSNISVSAIFSGSNTNLKRSSVDKKVEVQIIQENKVQETTDSLFPQSLYIVLGIGIVAVLFLFYLFFRYRESIYRYIGIDYKDEKEGIKTDIEGVDSDSGVDSNLIDRYIDVGREYLSSGRVDDAVVVGYEGLKSYFGDLFGVSSGLTHWEFYNECSKKIDDGKLDSLLDITETYERAAYSDEDIDKQNAKETIQKIQNLVKNT